MNLSFIKAAREHPDRTALVTEERAWTFRDLLPLFSNALHHFLDSGPEPGNPEHPVAFDATIRPETVVMIYALVELGIPFLPLHPALTPPERDAILEECRPALLLKRPLALEEDFSPLPPGYPALHSGRHPLAILYTSGSSASPKGVLLSRRAFIASAQASERNLGWRDDDRWALCMSIARIGGLSVVTRCLVARRPVFLAGPFDAAALAGMLEHHTITILSLVPTMLHRMLDLEPEWRPPKHLRAVLVGGAPLSSALLERSLARGVPVLPTYGSTETCSQVATQRFGTTPTAATGSGKPLDGVEIRTPGGHIHVRGSVVMNSYYPGNAHPNPFLDGHWLDTGDRGELDTEGYLHVWGRGEEVVLTGGENVSCPEVEAMLATFPAVEDVCVFGVEDEKWGEVVAVAIVWKADHPRDHDALRNHLWKQASPFKMPRRICSLPEMPRTPAGKIDRPAGRNAALHLLEKW